MKFSYSAVWEDTMRTLRPNSALVVAVAGAFLFLPTLLAAYFIPFPELRTAQEMMSGLSRHFAANWQLLLLARLFEMLGALSILVLVLKPGLTVGGAIALALKLLPSYFVAFLLWLLMVFAGVLLGSIIGGLLTVAGGPSPVLTLIPFLISAALTIYLVGRTALIGPAIVAEERRNPFAAVARSIALTRGLGWPVAGLVMILFVTGLVISMALSRAVGAIFILLAGPGVGLVLRLLVAAALTAALQTVLTIAYAAIYRRLPASGDPSPSDEGDLRRNA